MNMGDALKNANKYYRGPFAHSVTDFWGFNCAYQKCPSGDNPATRNGRNERQTINCQATAGTFTLKFRENSTMTLNFNEKVSVFAYRLEQLYTIHAVDVFYREDDLVTAASTDSLCSSDGSTWVVVDYLSEYGDLPLLEYTNIDLLDNGSAATFNIAEKVKGTKEDLECSGQGVCNEYNGICACRQGFGSSNGTVGGIGDRGDCTFYNRYDM